MFDQVWFTCCLSGRPPLFENLVNHPEMKNPACFAASRVLENRIWWNRELPVRLLGYVFVRGTRPPIRCLRAEPETGFPNKQGHTRTTQRYRRLRMYWICP